MKMKKLLCTIALCAAAIGASAQTKVERQFKENIPLDSIRLSDPCILADKKTKMYYMTGTGGLMWTSPDLARWTGPYKVTKHDPKSWMGPNPMIWAAELHEYKGKYYYFATFTNKDESCGTFLGKRVERRASHVLVADKPMGPYKPMKDEMYLPANRPTLDGTFWVEKDGTPYMVYCGEWLETNNGTMERIQLKPDLSGTIGEAKVLFTAHDATWSRSNEGGKIGPNKVTDGPYLFRTETGRLGMIWTNWIYDVYTQGVAYSQSGTIDGPWIQEKEPITPPNFGHAMLFRTFEGKLLMSIHSHKDIRGRYVRVPHLFEVDLSGGEIKVGKEYSIPPVGYRLVWSDEFDKDGKVDSKKWNFENGFCRNHELQWYQEDNASVQNGVLTIEARSENRPNPLYKPNSKEWRENRPAITCTSSSINTRGKFSFLYGRLECRARIPDGYGSWPAIWLLGEKLPWPSNGEIDVMEYYRIKGVPHILANAAWGSERAYNAIWNSKTTPLNHFTEKDPFWTSKFHIWRMDWDEKSLKIYLDDELLNDIDLSTTVNKSKDGINPFHHPQYILLNLAIGGDNGGHVDFQGFPMRYDIDYVRVYEKTESSAPNGKK